MTIINPACDLKEIVSLTDSHIDTMIQHLQRLQAIYGEGCTLELSELKQGAASKLYVYEYKAESLTYYKIRISGSK